MVLDALDVLSALSLAPEISISHVVRNFFAAEEFDGLFISNGPGDPEKPPGEKKCQNWNCLKLRKLFSSDGLEACKTSWLLYYIYTYICMLYPHKMADSNILTSLFFLVKSHPSDKLLGKNDKQLISSPVFVGFHPLLTRGAIWQWSACSKWWKTGLVYPSLEFALAISCCRWLRAARRTRWSLEIVACTWTNI